MITRKEKILWILYGAALLLLFLLSSTNLVIKERKKPIYAVSVIIEDTSDDNYINFRKGMDQAAMELNADVSFITLYDRGSKKQQEELILREQQDGCKALIVSPVEEEQVLKMQEDKRITVPMVLLNSEAGAAEDGIIEQICFDYYQMGKELGERILEEQGQDKKIYLFGMPEPGLVSTRFKDGILSVLEQANYEISFHQDAREEELKETARKTAEKEGRQAVIVALGPKALTAAAQGLSEPGEDLEIGGLYGRGTTVRLLNYLDKGVIQGLCITDDFSAGYLSVKMAVELAEKRIPEPLGYLKSRCIRREDLRNEEYEKLLYPIE